MTPTIKEMKRVAENLGADIYPDIDPLYIFTVGQLQAFAQHYINAERERCCSIVYGQCDSDNVAQRTVDAIRNNTGE